MEKRNRRILPVAVLALLIVMLGGCDRFINSYETPLVPVHDIPEEAIIRAEDLTTSATIEATADCPFVRHSWQVVGRRTTSGLKAGVPFHCLLLRLTTDCLSVKTWVQSR
jgi:hypothetical protein